jgi:diadenosine tetraphosphate (Ap4A) HIT family hydrolase
MALRFGPHVLHVGQVFFSSKLSLAFSNIAPVLPGHVLVIPRRLTPRFAELSSVEILDLWTTAQHVGKSLERHFKADALTFAIQDGASAGQSVPHVHIHILPRKPRDVGEDDSEIYDRIDRAEMSGERGSRARAAVSPDPLAARAARGEAAPRQPLRTMEEMEEEAAVFRKVLQWDPQLL